MKEKIRKTLKNRILIFILGGLIFSSVSVYAITYFPSNDVTYDNTKSGLTSTNVQGAIDELYKTCKTETETILDFIPIDSEGLYKDEFGNVRYYGANPNNYINFNDELWRIIGIVDNNTKIVRNSSLGYMAWNDNNSNNWNNSSLKSYLNGTYYNSIKKSYKDMIKKETFFLGGKPYYSQLLLPYDYFLIERAKINGVTVIASNNPYNTDQYIGLIYLSDYGYASGKNCLSTTLGYFTNECIKTNYLYKSSENIWSQMHDAMYSNQAITINKGHISSSATGFSYSVYPTLYLSSDIKITSGDGTQNNPYELE